jgi:hypothetical protein
VFTPRRFLTALRSAIRGAGQTRVQHRPARLPHGAARLPGHDGQHQRESTAGQSGPDATTELDPAMVRGASWGYSPKPDGALDPGEIVWTWVPYEERDGRGKDRPVVVTATLTDGAVLAVQLTSRDHTGDPDFVALGVGGWDRDRRPSWVAIDRIFRVTPGGVRREGTSVDAVRYRLVEQALRRRFGWR